MKAVATLSVLPLLGLLLVSLSGCPNASGEKVNLRDGMHGQNETEARSESPRDGPRSDPGRVFSDRRGEQAPTEVNSESPAARSSNPPAPDHAAGPLPDESDAPAPAPGAVHSDALVVNNETISVSDILEPLLPTIEKMSRELPPRTYYEQVGDLVRKQIIEAVAQHLIWRRAKSKITAEMEPQIDKTLDKIEKERVNREFGGSIAKYEKYLAQHHKTRADVRERLRRTVIIDSFLREHLLPLAASPRKRELQQYYEAHLDEFTKPSRRELFLIEAPISAFLDRRRPVTDTDLAEATGLARKVIDDAMAALAAGEPFEEAARQYSLGLNKSEGGAWGFIAAPLQGRWAAPSQRLFQMQAGEVSDVIEAEQCFFLVKCGQVETGGTISFQDAQPQIIDAMRQQRFSKLRAEFLQKELEQSTIGSLDAFVTEVLKVLPPPLTASIP